MESNVDWRLTALEGACVELIEWRRAEKPIDRLASLETQLTKLEFRLQEAELRLGVGVSDTQEHSRSSDATPRQPLLLERELSARETNLEKPHRACQPNSGWLESCIMPPAAPRDNATHTRHLSQRFLALQGSDENTVPGEINMPLESDDPVEDPVEEAINSLHSEIKDLEASVFGVAIASTCLVFGAKVPDTRLLVAVLVAWAVSLLTFVAQSYLIYQVKVYISYPAVANIRSTYADYERTVYVNGTFSDLAFNSLDDDFMRTICEFPISHVTFVALLLMTWIATCLEQLKLDFGRAAALLFLHTSTSASVRLKGQVANVGHVVVLEAASFPFKVTMCLLIFLPKVILQAFIAFIGCRWLVATIGFKEVLLNAVALTFITELDEMMYTVLLTDHMKDFHSLVKIDVRNFNSDGEMTKGAVVLVALSIIIPGGCYYYVYFGQHVLPDFKWDIYDPCTANAGRWNAHSSFWAW